MNKLLISLGLISASFLHIAFTSPPVTPKYDNLTLEIIREYETKCLVNDILDNNFYTCVDLKKYLEKKGYE